MLHSLHARKEADSSFLGTWLNELGGWLEELVSPRNRFVYALGIIGLLTWLVGLIRIEYLSGPGWLVNDLGVMGAVFLIVAVVFWFSWKDSNSKSSSSS